MTMLPSRSALQGIAPVLVTIIVISLLLVPFRGVSFADEGMWQYSDPPITQLKCAFGFEPSHAWLDHLRLSTVRVKSTDWSERESGAGCFVGKLGLVITCRHVFLHLPDLSWNWKRLLEIENKGFVATRPSEEIPCPGVEVEVLSSLEDVTDEVERACAKETSTIEKCRLKQLALANFPDWTGMP